MLILAIDTALDACSAALYDSVTARKYACETELLGKGHAERLMAMLSAVLSQAKIGFDDIQRIGVTIGPGRFTGIRVGLATARGLSIASGVPVVGISTLDAIARAAPDDGPVLVVLDARRGEVYSGLFDAARIPLSPPSLLSLVDAADLAITSGAALFGSGAPLVATAQPAANLIISGLAGYPEIIHVAELAARSPAPSAAPSPLYLRAPDAKPQTRGVVERAGGAA